MPKNIIICADGTGNTTIKGRGTNVFKLYEAIDENGHRFDSTLVQQVAIYHDGVGTERLKWLRIFAGATGWGLSRNVKQLYGELARVYDPGDHIFLFGFSRGAFTVRTLAGLIAACGILDLSRYGTNASFNRAIKNAYRDYRRKYQTRLSRLLRGRIVLDIAKLRQRYSVAIPAFSDPSKRTIDFIGVWDTVDAVGLPLKLADVVNRLFYAFKFPDSTLSQEVARACQALALDEERESFAPVLWTTQTPADRDRIEQVWFAGVHSNVGGGYPRQGMSLVALDWMMARAETAGLRFIPYERLHYRDRSDVNDRLYDSRAGLGILYRSKPRNVEALCHACSAVPALHRTVYERIARNTDGYAPGSVPPDAQIVTTSAPPVVTEVLRALVKQHHGERGPLVKRFAGTLNVGTFAYWLLIGGLISFAGFMAATYIADIAAAAHDWRTAVAVLADTIASSRWLSIAARTVWRHPWLVTVLATALALLLMVDARLDDGYSAFWHRLRVELRKALEGKLDEVQFVEPPTAADK